MTHFSNYELFKGTGANDVMMLGLIGEPSNGEIRVAERFIEGGERDYHEYVKPLAELEAELESGKLKRTGKTATPSKIRDTLSV